MDATAQQFDAVLRQNFPGVVHSGCLSRKLTLPERCTRDAAQLLAAPSCRSSLEGPTMGRASRWMKDFDHWAVDHWADRRSLPAVGEIAAALAQRSTQGEGRR